MRDVLLMAVTAAILGGCEQPMEPRFEANTDIDTQGMITLVDAVVIAQKAVPGAFAIEAELEIEDGDDNEPPAYEVELYVAADQPMVEVEVHAYTGGILEIEVEGEGGGGGGDSDGDGDDD